MSSNASLLTRARRLKSLIVRPFLGVYHLEGEFQDQPLSMVVAGDSTTLGYIRGLAFPKGCGVSRKGVVSQFKAPGLARAEADVVVIGASRLLAPKYREMGFSLAPRSVRLSLAVYDNPDSMVDNLPGSAREDLRRNIRRMKQNNYQCEITNDDDWFDLFYHRMYKPYAENKYGELTHLCGYRRLRYDFRRGMGISVRRDGSHVAGAVSYFNGSVMINHWKGILDGDQAVARDGASLALYYYRIQLAFERGYKTADFGYSAPFVTDGALNYKLKWGMEVVNRDNSRVVYAIAAPGRTEQAVRFLRANRFYCLNGKGLELCDDF
ncbi:MAG: GNAT family N-acetyltransferase [Armatimonadota bacterium]|nr:GNAT family N-acetyltransferase [Armatimonadota bacterium]